MKKTGYPPHYAGAVEACASTGGVLMPPIMGATAFVMAEFLQVPYVAVIAAALLPSLLYYMCLFAQIDAFAAEMIDRFGPLPEPTQNLITLMEIKLNAARAGIAKLDIGPKGALVAFRDDAPPNIPGLIAYVDKLQGTAKLRPDSKLAIARAWPSPAARLNGALQLSKGLAKIAG